MKDYYEYRNPNLYTVESKMNVLSDLFIHGKKHVFMLLFVYLHHDRSERLGESKQHGLGDNNAGLCKKMTESSLN